MVGVCFEKHVGIWGKRLASFLLLLSSPRLSSSQCVFVLEEAYCKDGIKLGLLSLACSTTQARCRLDLVCPLAANGLLFRLKPQQGYSLWRFVIVLACPPPIDPQYPAPHIL